MAWWDLPIRSGRASASGTAFWYDRANDPIAATARLASEELDVALIDAMCASSTGATRGNVQTWARLIGDAPSVPIATGALHSIDTQFDWRTTTSFGFGHAIAHLPTGGSYATDGSGWLIWTSQSIPSDEATSEASSPIWAAVSAGTHDAKYIKFGERVVQKMATTGHPLKRLIIDFNHEMNQSNDFQIWAGNLTAYKNAMQRTIAKVREGADNITPGAGAILKFMHRPAYRVDQGATKIGAYNSFIPIGIDVLALSIHPDASCNSVAACNQLFAGTLNSQWYGTDELISAAIDANLPIAFPEWSPQYQTLSANGGACPAAETFVSEFYAKVIQLNRARLVCDCIWNQNVRDKTGYTATDAEGIAQWSAMVDTRKALWVGTQSDASVPTSDSFSYTVQDDWGTRTANVACTIQGGTVLFVNASPDTANTSPGVAVVIPVLDNDQASPGLTLVIEPGSISPPLPSGSGTAVATTDNKIRFTPASGIENLAVSFNYTAKPSSAISPVSWATVQVQVSGGGTPAPTGDFPTVSGSDQVFQVNAGGDFDSAYAAAGAGDHIVVRNGLALGNKTLSKNGGSGYENMIVIRSAVNQGASAHFSVSGNNQFIYGFNGGDDFSLTADSVTFRRMHWHGKDAGSVGFAYICRMDTSDTKWEYCTFNTVQSGALRWDTASFRNTLKFCHFNGIHSVKSDEACEALILGQGYKEESRRANHLVEDCLFENCNMEGLPATENETISSKCAANIFRRVQFNQCQNLNMRFGEDCQVIGCVVPAGSNKGNLTFRGRNHIANNCSGTIIALAGNRTTHTGSTVSYFPNCVSLDIIRGDGQITNESGSGNQNVSATGTRVEGRPGYPASSAPVERQANFPLNQGTNNNVVGINGK